MASSRSLAGGTRPAWMFGPDDANLAVVERTKKRCLEDVTAVSARRGRPVYQSSPQDVFATLRPSLNGILDAVNLSRIADVQFAWGTKVVGSSSTKYFCRDKGSFAFCEQLASLLENTVLKLLLRRHGDVSRALVAVDMVTVTLIRCLNSIAPCSLSVASRYQKSPEFLRELPEEVWVETVMKAWTDHSRIAKVVLALDTGWAEVLFRYGVTSKAASRSPSVYDQRLRSRIRDLFRELRRSTHTLENDYLVFVKLRNHVCRDWMQMPCLYQALAMCSEGNLWDSKAIVPILKGECQQVLTSELGLPDYGSIYDWRVEMLRRGGNLSDLLTYYDSQNSHLTYRELVANVPNVFFSRADLLDLCIQQAGYARTQYIESCLEDRSSVKYLSSCTSGLGFDARVLGMYLHLIFSPHPAKIHEVCFGGDEDNYLKLFKRTALPKTPVASTLGKRARNRAAGYEFLNKWRRQLQMHSSDPTSPFCPPTFPMDIESLSHTHNAHISTRWKVIAPLLREFADLKPFLKQALVVPLLITTLEFVYAPRIAMQLFRTMLSDTAPAQFYNRFEWSVSLARQVGYAASTHHESNTTYNAIGLTHKNLERIFNRVFNRGRKPSSTTSSASASASASSLPPVKVEEISVLCKWSQELSIALSSAFRALSMSPSFYDKDDKTVDSPFKSYLPVTRLSPTVYKNVPQNLTAKWYLEICVTLAKYAHVLPKNEVEKTVQMWMEVHCGFLMADQRRFYALEGEFDITEMPDSDPFVQMWWKLLIARAKVFLRDTTDINKTELPRFYLYSGLYESYTRTTTTYLCHVTPFLRHLATLSLSRPLSPLQRKYVETVVDAVIESLDPAHDFGDRMFLDCGSVPYDEDRCKIAGKSILCDTGNISSALTHRYTQLSLKYGGKDPRAMHLSLHLSLWNQVNTPAQTLKFVHWRLGLLDFLVSNCSAGAGRTRADLKNVALLRRVREVCLYGRLCLGGASGAPAEVQQEVHGARVRDVSLSLSVSAFSMHRPLAPPQTPWKIVSLPTPRPGTPSTLAFRISRLSLLDDIAAYEDAGLFSGRFLPRGTPGPTPYSSAPTFSPVDQYPPLADPLAVPQPSGGTATASTSRSGSTATGAPGSSSTLESSTSGGGTVDLAVTGTPASTAPHSSGSQPAAAATTTTNYPARPASTNPLEGLSLHHAALPPIPIYCYVPTGPERTAFMRSQSAAGQSQAANTNTTTAGESGGESGGGGGRGSSSRSSNRRISTLFEDGAVRSPAPIVDAARIPAKVRAWMCCDRMRAIDGSVASVLLFGWTEKEKYLKKYRDPDVRDFERRHRRRLEFAHHGGGYPGSMFYHPHQHTHHILHGVFGGGGMMYDDDDDDDDEDLDMFSGEEGSGIWDYDDAY